MSSNRAKAFQAPLSNPAKRFLEWKSNDKCFSYFDKEKKENVKVVYGYPVTGKAYNQVWDVQRRLPIYSKTSNSKSLFCAGYYLIKLNYAWVEHFCPKNITISRYEYHGPFKTKEEMHTTVKELQCKS